MLKPNGELIIKDASIESFSTTFGRVLKKLMVHPYEKMYSKNEFIAHLRDMKFDIHNEQSHRPFCLLNYFTLVAKNRK